MDIKRCTAILTALGLMVGTASAAEMSLSADRLDYNMATGYGTAAGHVKIVREGVTITANRGEAWSNSQKVHLWSDVLGTGVHEGQPIDFGCRDATADFAVQGGHYHMIGAVALRYGQRSMVAEEADLKGRSFWAKKVSRFDDAADRAFMKANGMSGAFDDKGLTGVTATGSAYIKRTDEKGTTTEIWGDRMVYDRAQDRVTATGNARAVQQGRALKAREIVYRMAAGTLRATGQTQIVVDMPGPASKESPKPAIGSVPAKAKPAGGRR